VIKIYREKEEILNKKMKNLEEKTKERDDEREKWETLKQKRYDEFMAGFRVVSFLLKQMYQV
jgi:structural maintenance of chromosome 4